MLHLTTRQYAVHRLQILEDVRRRLKGGRACRLIATPLIEAGVDVNFSRVFCAEAGLDQIAQAAGRCNREGGRDPETSVVTVFEPVEIKGLIGDFARIQGKHADFFAPAAIQDCFEEVFRRVGDGLDREDILKKFRVDATRTNFAYRSAGEACRLIESCLLPVIVPGARLRARRLPISTIRPFLPANSPGSCKAASCRRRRRRDLY